MRAPDGAKIVYDVRGRGDTALVFIHCWAGDRSFWHRELERFQDRYRVVALDLPGHGESGDERTRWSVASYGADVEAVVRELELPRVILIGHSMGGPISLAAARRLEGRVIGVIGIDTLHDADFVFPPELAERIAQGFEQDFEGSMTAGVQSMVAKESPPEASAWILDKALHAHRAPVIAVMRDFANVDVKTLLQGAGVPVRCINKEPLSAQDMSTAVEKNRRYADFDAVIMANVGHYPMIERPAEFDEKLEGVIDSLD